MRTTIRVSAAALAANLDCFRQITGRPVAFVVKANAYGHGIEACVEIASKLDSVGYYAVDAAHEARRVLTRDDSRPVLVMGWADRDELEYLVEAGVEMVVPEPGYLERVRAAARKVNGTARCHLKVETGTRRLGMTPAEVLEILRSPAGTGVEFCGIYSHFADIEDTTRHDFAGRQLESFRSLLEELPSNRPMVRHMACSAAALLFPATHFNLVRLGISAYGYWPSRETLISWQEQKGNGMELRPALTWETRVAQVKTVAAGESVGYGRSYRAFSPSRIAVIPVGYYDGYDRRLSNSGVILVNGREAPIRGRICMNMMMADVTHIPNVRAGDSVILLGEGAHGCIDAVNLADHCGTIHYEILSRIAPHLPRIAES
ncbi:MAG TPA: alanine racemase [Candidatus Aminicenantes bacterium]|nr:alanine racemase [Candidatus Aminicenantes bacterium]